MRKVLHIFRCATNKLFRVKPIFIIQQYGQKRILKSAEELHKIHAKHAALFDLTMVYTHKLGQKAMSYIDIASDIR